MEKNLLKDKILFKIYGMWFFRRSAPLLVTELLIGVIAFYFLAKNVFIERIISNAFSSALGSPFKFVVYFLNAFWVSNFLNQLISILIVLSLIFLLRDINKSFVAYAAMKRKKLFEKIGLES
ncbi:MAG: hypothetical protein EXS49_01520 [Candidatus Pacebacteria bacterium]|nr:hypothetical protein [Candidatus Paceibacterota bacterium]